MNKNKEFYLEDYSMEDILKTTKGYYINYKEIWSYFEEKFALTYSVVQKITKKWLGEVYNLKRVTTSHAYFHPNSSWERTII